MEAEIAAPEFREPVRREMLRQMKKILQEKGLGYVQFYVNFVDEIKVDTKTGKKQLIIKRYRKGDVA